MQTTASTPTTPEADRPPPYRLGMFAWFLAWVVAIVGMCYSMVNPGSPVKFPTLGVMAFILLSDLGPMVVRVFRRKQRPRSDASFIADPLPGADERQRLLHDRVRVLAGVAGSYGVGVLFIFLGLAASAAGIRIDSDSRWVGLSATISAIILVTYVATKKMAALYYSRKG